MTAKQMQHAIRRSLKKQRYLEDSVFENLSPFQQLWYARIYQNQLYRIRMSSPIVETFIDQNAERIRRFARG